MEKLIVETYAPTEQINRVIPPPTPASRTIPEWYKGIPRHSDNLNKTRDTFTVKACIPYLDAMTAGYTLNTWCDIEIQQVNVNGIIEPAFRWDSELWPIEDRPISTSTGLQRLNGYSNWSFAWNMPWGIKTPEGYSALITHPLNRPDLPFITFSGLVDTDLFSAPGSALFCISTGFEGVIPKGTPFLQVIPIKRHAWELKVNNDLRGHQNSLREEAINLEGGTYKSKHWTKKDYS
jgi:hypothetical protein